MRYYVLGPLEVVGPGGLPIVINAKRIRALLAILLLHPGRVVTLDRIIDGIWDDAPPRSAVENVRTYTCQLRTILRGSGHRDRLDSHPGGYRLHTHPEELDLQRFTTLVGNGQLALRSGGYANAVTLLGDAIGLWRGTPLAELELGAEMRAKTVALEELRWQAQTDWINARLALGERAGLVAPLQELIGERPLDEGLWCSLVMVLHAIGRTSEALAAFAQARERLVRELGVEPGPALRKVHAAVLEGAAVLDVAWPERRWTTSAVLTPRQLPGAPTLIGRDAEVARVRALVDRTDRGAVDHVPTVLVSGVPGVGKSATAVAAGRAVCGAHPDGEIYLDLRGSTAEPRSPSDAIAELLGTLGLMPEAIPRTWDGRQALYRSVLAERRALIVLDDAADANQVISLLPGLGRSLLIVTSRRWLVGIRADVHLALEPLSVSAAVQMLSHLIGVDRTEREYAAATAIVEACGRLPAAIRIVGARLAARPRHPLRFLAENLRDGERVLDELVVDGMSLRRLFDTSRQALDPACRRAFGMCGRLASDRITAADLGAALGLPAFAADRLLERLVHEGLLISREPESGVPTYHLPRILGLYARECFARDVEREKAG
ncbi:AfsR/SARP family transcriptional regulator [Actinomadura decatromicini]|uniref:AAA family ATPase n=1 Tax=Actinomadura decatromicini TaxID=2604572 RepID=A0A5D3FW12_9ACTN|nr:BTAD domain-containing putative transcriptional regulator [Actinomadura decatromicini]TYK52423.1 AAA family ATPase [Actinomadura decatromicini]